MPQRTAHVVDKLGRTPCGCSTLMECVRRDDIPIKYDNKLNEFHIVRPNGYTIIRYCPFCGELLPVSKRGDMFQRLTVAERKRLKRRFGHLLTADSVISALGPPDRDIPEGVVTEDRFRDRRKRTIQRTLSYFGLSKTALILFAIEKNGRTQMMFVPKQKVL